MPISNTLMVTSLASVKRAATLLGLENLVAAVDAVPKVVGRVHIYGLTSQGEVVAVTSKLPFILRENQLGISAAQYAPIERLKMEAHALQGEFTGLQELLTAAEARANGKKLKLIRRLSKEGIQGLFNIHWTQIEEPKAKPRPGVQGPSKPQKAFWNDPDKQNWH